MTQQLMTIAAPSIQVWYELILLLTWHMFTSVAATHFTLQVLLLAYAGARRSLRLLNPGSFLRKVVKGTYTYSTWLAGVWIVLVAIKGLAIGLYLLMQLATGL